MPAVAVSANIAAFVNSECEAISPARIDFTVNLLQSDCHISAALYVCIPLDCSGNPLHVYSFDALDFLDHLDYVSLLNIQGNPPVTSDSQTMQPRYGLAFFCRVLCKACHAHVMLMQSAATSAL